MEKTEAIAILRGMNKYARTSGRREALEIAVEALRNEVYYIDTAQKIVDNIGNKYVFHTESTDDYTTGYNTAIRDVLGILKKGDF